MTIWDIANLQSVRDWRTGPTETERGVSNGVSVVVQQIQVKSLKTDPFKSQLML